MQYISDRMLLTELRRIYTNDDKGIHIANRDLASLRQAYGGTWSTVMEEVVDEEQEEEDDATDEELQIEEESEYRDEELESEETEEDSENTDDD